jgi:hypothetical protein
LLLLLLPLLLLLLAARCFAAALSLPWLPLLCGFTLGSGKGGTTAPVAVVCILLRHLLHT